MANWFVRVDEWFFIHYPEWYIYRAGFYLFAFSLSCLFLVYAELFCCVYICKRKKRNRVRKRGGRIISRGDQVDSNIFIGVIGPGEDHLPRLNESKKRFISWLKELNSVYQRSGLKDIKIGLMYVNEDCELAKMIIEVGKELNLQVKKIQEDEMEGILCMKWKGKDVVGMSIYNTYNGPKWNVQM